MVLVTSRNGVRRASQPRQRLGGAGNGGAAGVEGAVEVEQVRRRRMAWLSHQAPFRLSCTHRSNHSRMLMPVITLLAHAALLARLAAPPYPFAVGETLQYEAKLGMLPDRHRHDHGEPDGPGAGTRGVRLRRHRRGRPLGVRVGCELTSWVGTAGFNSLRFDRRLVPGQQRGRGAVPDHPRLEPVPPGRACPRTGRRRAIRSTSSPSSTISAPCR